MGDPEQADEKNIPSYDQITSPHYKTIQGHTLISANYELIADNLLDLSHGQFVHANFAQADDLLKVKHEVHQTGHTVHSRRWVPNIKPPASFARSLSDPEGRVDHWVRARWDAPGLHRLDVGVTPVGQDEGAGIRREGSHLLTPESETTTHYIFANSRNYKIDDAAEDEKIYEWQRVGFGEQDKPIIEAVQRMIGSNDLLSLKPVLLTVDAAALRARRVMKNLRELESGKQG